MKHLIYACLFLLLIGCEKENNGTSETVMRSAQNRETEMPAATVSKEQLLTDANKEIIAALKAGDTKKLATYIHPDRGITFTMYGFIDPVTAKHFNRKEFIRYGGTPVKFTWGPLDGTGESYVRSIGDFLRQWVFAQDFSQTKLYINRFRGSGNSINNLQKIYPEADFTENYFEGTEEYSNMDWQALRLVFEQYQGKYYLIAVVTDRWTI